MLTSQPTGNVVIDATSLDLTEGRLSTDSVTQMDSASVTFTSANWSVPRTITVHGIDDFVADGDTPYVISATNERVHRGSEPCGQRPADVAATNTDNDTAGVTVAPSGGTTTTTEAGSSDTFTVVLNSQPSGNVVIDATSLAVTEARLSTDGVTPMDGVSLTFTTANWNVPRTVTVDGADDVPAAIPTLSPMLLLLLMISMGVAAYSALKT